MKISRGYTKSRGDEEIYVKKKDSKNKKEMGRSKER